MAALAFPYEVRDSSNSTTDNRKTGLTPTVSDGKTLAASPATVTASGNVTFVEIGSGIYAFLYDAEAHGDAAFPVDWGSSLSNPNDRYGSLVFTRDAGRVLASLPASGIVSANVEEWLGGTPNALVSGKVDASASVSLGANAPDGWIRAATFAASAIDANAFAQAAADKAWATTSRTLSAFGFTVTATLATSQPNYAPAKAGDQMTLTSAYDAAKAAATAAGVVTALAGTAATFRDQTSVTAPTLMDCWAAAWADAAGTEAVVAGSPPTYTKHGPSSSTFRTFTLDSATAPTSRA